MCINLIFHDYIRTMISLLVKFTQVSSLEISGYTVCYSNNQVPYLIDIIHMLIIGSTSM